MSAAYPDHKIIKRCKEKNGAVLAKAGGQFLYEIYELKNVF